MKRLFCVPGGGTTSILFIQWQKYLNRNDLKIEYLDIPGRGYMNKKKEEKTMPAIGRSLAEEIAKKADGDGYSVFGYCFGAVAGYEICLALEDMRLPPPDHFYVCGSYPPVTENEVVDVLKIRERRDEMVRMFYHMFPPYLFKSPDLQKKICSRYMELLYRRLDETGTLGKIDHRAPEFSELPEADDDTVEYVVSLANRYFDEYQKDGKILIDYCNQEKENRKIETPITVIYGKEDDIIGDEWKLWRNWTDKTLSSVEIDTDHFSLVDDTQFITDLIKRTEGVEHAN